VDFQQSRLGVNEIGQETDTLKYKVGDGSTRVTGLAYQGVTGPAGPQGDAGPQGIQGVPGDTGPQGLQAYRGPPEQTAPFLALRVRKEYRAFKATLALKGLRARIASYRDRRGSRIQGIQGPPGADSTVPGPRVQMAWAFPLVAQRVRC